jgi:hypothetical protein
MTYDPGACDLCGAQEPEGPFLVDIARFNLDGVDKVCQRCFDESTHSPGERYLVERDATHVVTVDDDGLPLSVRAENVPTVNISWSPELGPIPEKLRGWAFLAGQPDPDDDDPEEQAG